MNRDEVLEAARQAVVSDRESTHGSAINNLSKIADLWSAYLSQPLTSTDVAAMMILLKVARSRSNATYSDHWIDAAGYAALAAEVAGD